MSDRRGLIDRRLGRHLARCHLVPQVPKIQLRVAKESEFLRKIPSKVLVYVFTSPDTMPKSKSKKAKAKKPTKSKKAPIPPGFRSVTPYLAINGASAAIDWYKKAFGAKELARQAVPDGKLMHARIRIGDSIVMLSDTFPGSGAQSPDALGNSPVTLHLYIGNVDKVWQQAVDAGAKITMPLDNQFWGERYGQLTDPYGHHWSLASQVNMTKKEKDEKQKQAMAMFAQDQHPGRTEEPQVIQN